jgi:hypothetical protein
MEKHAGGRPTKYKKEYCKTILDFYDKPAAAAEKRTIVTKSGIQSYEVQVPNPLPTKEGFARFIGVSSRVINEWLEHHEEFLHAYERARDCQKDILTQNALMGRYSEGYAKFVAINCTDMVDKTSRELTGKDGGPVEFTDLERATRLTRLIELAKQRERHAKG